MSRRERPRHVTVEARAKLNLGLAVGRRRPDGFHDIATVYQSISLADTLTVRPRRGGFTLAVRWQRAAARGRLARSGRVPRGAGNLVIRAARLLAARVGIPGGAAFHLVKRIPARAGLGGGSADAAAALAGLAALYGVRRPRERWLEIAATLGSDVPFALTGGTALGTGRGERLEALRLAQPFRALVAVPAWGVSTATAYAALDRRRKSLTAWRPHLRFSQILGRERLRAERAIAVGNVFEGVLGARTREFEALRRRLESAGATSVGMTGSGSAVAGLLPVGMAASLAIRRFRGREAIYLVRSMGRGLKLIRSS